MQRFVEKPDAQKALEYLESGRFLWNSGMFVWSNSAINAALERYAPETQEALQDAPQQEDLAKAYEGLASASIDTGYPGESRRSAGLPSQSNLERCGFLGEFDRGGAC